ncbi:MAG: tetratricopeptide repeat protein [Williamsia sp.]|nr:tetratricopeptide repeat protein [Williamsia sp.]
MNKRVIISILSVLIACSAFSQIPSPSLSFDLKKPPKFENKTLGSEKTATKKFTKPRHFIQNTVTHYNYFFNANNKLNEVLERAKIAHKEDYTQLLPFYNYSLTETAQYKTELDSVIYKSTAGILIHDLRNDWIDNLYLLIGKAYYLRNSLDSAYLTFQYINYAFSPKEKDGYDKVIGSNADEGSNIFSISTKEKRNIVKDAFSRPPSRNESLLWQVKTYLGMDAMPEASSLIETLKNDPQFPDRLRSGLEEAQAFYFYKQLAYDSAAAHLVLALDNAENKQEQARWEYLLAQLYERAGKADLAEKYYDQTIRHTIDPIMEVYARLNSIRQNKSGDKASIDNAVNELIRMARRDRYLFYRDIIYFTAATIELERNNPEVAKSLLQRSIQTSTSNPIQRSKSFLALGDIYFDQKKYVQAKGAYDSVITQYMLPDDAKQLAVRTAALAKVVVQQAVLDRQDSLRRIAAMPDKERETFLRSMVKRLRRERGMNENELPINPGGSFDNQAGPADMFNNNASKSSWSFEDASQKGKGLNDFKTRWGNRPNVDNWRRQAAVAQAANFNRPPDPAMAAGLRPDGMTGGDMPPSGGELNYESLLNSLPLTPEKQKISADSVEHALFELGRAYMSGLEDYYSAIDALEKLVQDFPASNYQEEALFNLYYCYLKVGKPANQLQVQKLLASKYPGGKFSSLLTSANPALTPDSLQKVKATKQYQDIYNLFIEGDFDRAVAMKRTADSVYGQHFWTPQLLYIEGVYYIRQRNDSTATSVLNKIIQLYPSSPMAPKTANLLSVLSRRKEIEDYLTKLQITRPAEDAVVIVDDEKPAPKKQPVVVPPPVKDTAAVAVEEPIKKANAASVKKEVDQLKTPVTVNAGKAGRPDSLQIVKRDIPDSLLRAFRNDTAAAVAQRTEPVIPKTTPPTKTDSSAIANTDKPKRVDSVQVVKKKPISNGVYSEDADEAHYAVLVLNKVDPVYVNEARNAFNRYHREQYYGKPFEVSSETLNDDNKLVIIKGFGNAAEALDYIGKARPRAASDIIPWLTPQKYSFLIVTAANLEVLHRTIDLAGYKSFLQSVYPGKL